MGEPVPVDDLLAAAADEGWGEQRLHVAIADRVGQVGAGGAPVPGGRGQAGWSLTSHAWCSAHPSHACCAAADSHLHASPAANHAPHSRLCTP